MSLQFLVEILLAFLFLKKKECTTSNLLLPFLFFQLLWAASPLRVVPGSTGGGAALARCSPEVFC